jgi:hypothetical protein
MFKLISTKTNSISYMIFSCQKDNKIFFKTSQASLHIFINQKNKQIVFPKHDKPPFFCPQNQYVVFC